VPIATYPPQNVTAQTPLLAYAERTSSHTGIGTTPTDVTGLSATVTVPAGRRIRLTAHALLQKQTTAGFMWFRIYEGATGLSSFLETSSGQGATGYVGAETSVITTPTAGTHTYKVVAYGENATLDVLGAPDNPAYLAVEDVTGSQLPVLPQSVPVGVLGYATITSDVSTNSATFTDIPGLSVNVAVQAGRTLRVSVSSFVFSTVAGDAGGVRILRDGNIIRSGSDPDLEGTYGDAFHMEVLDSPSAGSHVYSVQFARQGGTGFFNFAGRPTSPGTLVVEDVTSTPAPGQGAPGSTLAHAPVTVQQGPFTADTDLTGFSATVTVPAGRRIRVSVQATLSGTVAGDEVRLNLKEGASLLNLGQLVIGTGGKSQVVEFDTILSPTAGTHTYKVSLQRFTGTGTVTLIADPAVVAFLLIEDITGAVWPAGSTVTAGMVASETWTDYVPTLTNLTVGNGTLTARYFKLGRFVSVNFQFVFGSTSAIAGGVSFTLPVAPASYYTGDFHLGGVSWVDAGATVFGGYASWTGSAVLLRLWRTDATYLTFAGPTATVPFTWGTGDFITTSFTYEAAS